MKVSDLYNNKKTVVSMEFFPPRNEKNRTDFEKTVTDLTLANPDFMTMTFGAGGSTRDGSYDAVKFLVETKKQPTVAYIAGYGLSPREISHILGRYRDLGVQTIFVIRGDIPKDDAFVRAPDSFNHASEMIGYIRPRFDVDLGCAGYPEGHLEAESLEKDIHYLREKVAQGAAYVVTQYFFDNGMFFRYVDLCRAAGIQVPIVPGIMPVYSVKLLHSLCRICGASLSVDLKKKLDAVNPEDGEAVLNLGIDYATEQCRGLLEQGVPGLHFYTMDRSRSTLEILSRLRKEGRL